MSGTDHTDPGDTGPVISTSVAERLHRAGLAWRPRSGDRFAIRAEQLADQVFTVSEMVVEVHDFPTGTVLGFNGTTEWALDAVRVEDALWLPREDQLRELLGPAFVALERPARGGYRVVADLPGRPLDGFEAADAADAYAGALLALLAAD